MRKFESLGGKNADRAMFQGRVHRVTSARFVDEGRHVHYGIRDLKTNRVRTVRSDKLQVV